MARSLGLQSSAVRRRPVRTAVLGREAILAPPAHTTQAEMGLCKWIPQCFFDLASLKPVIDEAYYGVASDGR
jgi:hypothetical protein